MHCAFEWDGRRSGDLEANALPRVMRAPVCRIAGFKRACIEECHVVPRCGKRLSKDRAGRAHPSVLDRPEQVGRRDADSRGSSRLAGSVRGETCHPYPLSASSILATKPSSGPSVTSTRGSARGSSDALTPRSSHVTARRKPARRAAVTVRLSTAPNGYARLSTVAPL